jgi:hypothetical protein
MTRWLAINKCPHGVFTIAINYGSGGGLRLTQSSEHDCGMLWTTLYEWPLSRALVNSIVTELQRALEQQEEES